MTQGLYLEVDPRFRPLMIGPARLEQLMTGCRWAEGPAYFPAGRYLVWSDFPNDRLMRFDETDGSVSVFRQPAFAANGSTRDREGRLLTCEHGSRAVTRTEFDGSRIVLADRYQGRRLNSPNDVIVQSDGSVWFTDPSYGIEGHYNGGLAEPEQAANRLYRIDPGGKVHAMADDFFQPNGLAFSPDEKTLYVVDSGFTHGPDKPRHIRAFAVKDGGRRIAGGKEIATCDNACYDGLRVDTAGNLWVGAGDGVHVLASDGAMLGRILIPEIVANLCFGGPHRNRLYICGTTSLYALYVMAYGCEHRI
ncbi:MAG TPA: SMP-30/gluconolactonase/LRE family protein [Dongiaceae bacterium]|jgi:gluconolactonase|nr:SMP-30/gluconolactonase/LRE family protein [Dongiaceae bacterium]